MNLMDSFDAAIRATRDVVAHRRQAHGLTPMNPGGCDQCRRLENARLFAVTNYYAEAESLTERTNLVKGR